jgi:hypothetical protein
LYRYGEEPVQDQKGFVYEKKTIEAGLHKLT